MEEMVAEVNAEETAPPNGSGSKTSTAKSTTTAKKTSNSKDSASKSSTYPKVNSRTVPKKVNTSSGIPSVRPYVPGRSPVTGRRNPPVVSMRFLVL